MFDENSGVESGANMKPQSVVKAMLIKRDDTGKLYFEPKERLSEQQIKSLFGKWAREQKQKLLSEDSDDSDHSSGQAGVELDDVLSEEAEEDDADQCYNELTLEIAQSFDE